MGIKARTRARSVKCRVCKKPFTARSGKAKYCSTSCSNRMAYLRRTEGVYNVLLHVHRKIDSLYGHDKHIDPWLQKILAILDEIESGFTR